MVVVVPLRKNGQDDGFLQFAAQWRDPRELTSAFRNYGIVAGLFGFATVLISAWVLTRWLTLPIERLYSATQRFRGGDLKARSGLSVSNSQNEFYLLAESFDQLAGNVEESLIAQRRFVADASHELKTPLTAISGMAEMLKISENPEKRNKAIQIILRESERMTGLVVDLLVLSKIEQAPTEPGIGRCCLGKIGAEVFEVVKIAHPDRDLDCELDSELFVFGNPDELGRMIRNLLENAVQHTPSNCPVRLLCKRTPTGILVQISDQGPGIEARDLPHIFERFYRPDSSRTRRTGGSGLGLAIVKSIATRHGGRVQVVSQPGQGSVFQIWFEGTR